MDSNKLGNNGLASFGGKYWQLWGRIDWHQLGNIGLALFGKNGLAAGGEEWTGTSCSITGWPGLLRD